MTQEMDRSAGVRATEPPRGSQPGRAPEVQRTAYHVAGVLLLLYGMVSIAWRVYGFGVADVTVYSPLAVLTDPDENPMGFALLSLYEWGFAAAMLVVALFLFARRTAARGGAIWIACLLLAGVLRQAFALLSEEYRESILAADLGWLLLATYVFCAVVGAVVLVAMLRAREADDVPRVGHAVAYRVAGVLLIVLSLNNLRLLVWNPALDYTATDVADYAMWNLRLIASPGNASMEMAVGASYLYGLLATLSMLVIGVLALLRKRFVRGAAIVVLSIELYGVAVALVFPLVGASWASAGIAVSYVAVTLVIPLMVIVALVVFARDSDKRALASDRSHAPGSPALAGDLGEQDTGGD
ncbi:hypothetical protein [Haloechinothrix halophila]|uniref:hypothetical protein n=1 Tax=Haloechinothrix halophila TaxID=1069073 RepID=UPI000552179C|nr:hypothetical protein [Haloechinothrix halophila]